MPLFKERLAAFNMYYCLPSFQTCSILRLLRKHGINVADSLVPEDLDQINGKATGPCELVSIAKWASALGYSCIAEEFDLARYVISEMGSVVWIV